jgi:uncharacterized protein (TIGR02391 family)
MASFPPLSDGQLQTVAQILGECATGSEISNILSRCGLVDNSGQSTKWRRLYWVFSDYQSRYRSANGVLDFTRTLLEPARFVGRNQEFESHRGYINTCLALAGLEYGADGQFRQVTAARTLSEAESRVQTIRAKFQGRRIHPEVLKYCRAELLQDNYFHAVFEAAKGVAQRIRDLSGVQADGAALVDRVFSVESPFLAMNSLQNPTEKSEHIGFAMLLKGCFAAVRNPLAHEPRILWEGEDDAADYLSLLSLLHKKLDECFVVPGRGP